MKRLGNQLSAVFILILALSLAQPVISQTQMSDAEICETLGILKGTGSGITVEYLESTPARIQAAIMFLRLKGLEEKAKTYQGQDNFSDVGRMWDEGRAMLAFLKANPELGWLGDGGGMFRPLEVVTRSEYAKVLLSVLGYEQGIDFEWKDVDSFASEKGIEIPGEGQSGFTVRDMASATVKALNTHVKGTEKTLIEVLVEKGIVTAKKAEATGLYKPLPDVDTTPPEVLSAGFVEGSRIKVLFSEPVSADRKELYEVNEGQIDIEKVIQSEDGKEVYLLLSQPPKKGVVTLRVSGNVKDLAGLNLKPRLFELVIN